jgi:hypothetical protein
MFSLARTLPSANSAASACCSVALFAGVIGIAARSDSSPPYAPGLRLSSFPAGLALLPPVSDEVSRFSCM